MALIDIGLRGAAGAVLAAVVLVLLRDAAGARAGRFGALLAVGAGAYLACSAPAFDGLPGQIRLGFLVFCVANPVFFWLFARALFDDDFAPGVPAVALFLGFEGFGMLRVLGQAAMPGWLDGVTMVSFQLAGLALVFHALALAFAGRAGDLVETRRRLRVQFIALVGAYMVMIAVAELVLRDARPAEWLAAANAAGILAVGLFLLTRMVRLRRADLFAPPARPAPAASSPTLGTTDPRDRALLEQIRRVMADDRVYLAEGLRIGGLADRLGIPEYRLRRLINQDLGYRNFPAFLNHYRLADAKAALADPAKAHLPVLTIALDLGYGSIGPFNRAFKAAVGVAPSAYRAARLAEAGPDTPKFD